MTLITPRECRAPVVAQLSTPREGRAPWQLTTARELRAGIVPASTVPREGRARVVPQSFYSAFVAAPATGKLGDDLVPAVDFKLLLNGSIDLGPWVQSWQFRWPRNGRISWSVTLCEDQDLFWTVGQVSDLVPPGRGSLADLIRPAKRGTTSPYLVARYTVAGVTVDLPTLIPGSPDWNAPNLTWQGTDLSALLELEGQNMPDVTFTSASAVLLEIGTQYGVPVVCRFGDYSVAKMHRVDGSPLSWMDQVVKVRQAGRRAEGGALVFEQARFADGNWDWEFQDWQKLEQLSLRCNADQVKNLFRATRLEPVEGTIGEQKLNGPESVGRTGAVTFSRAVRNAYGLFTAVDGDLVNFSWWDENGLMVAASQIPFYNGARPVSRVEFTYQPVIHGDILGTGRATAVAGFEIFFYGGRPPARGPYDNQFDQVTQDAAHIALWGQNPEFASLESGLIPTGGVAQECVQDTLHESTLKTWVSNWVSPWFNPLLRPNDTVRLTDRLSGLAQSCWLVDVVEHRMKEKGALELAIECLRPTL